MHINVPKREERLPERYRCVRSQAGTRTRLESVTFEQFLASNSLSLVDDFKIRSIDSLSTNGCVKELKLFIMQATLSSSRCGKPGDAICSFNETGVSETWLLVIRSIRSFWQPSCSFSMCMCPVAVSVRTFDRSNTSKFGQWVCKQRSWVSHVVAKVTMQPTVQDPSQLLKNWHPRYILLSANMKKTFDQDSVTVGNEIQ